MKKKKTFQKSTTLWIKFILFETWVSPLFIYRYTFVCQIKIKDVPVKCDRHDSCRVSCRLTQLSLWLGTSFPITFYVNLEFRKLGSTRWRNYGLESLGRETAFSLTRAVRVPFSSTPRQRVAFFGRRWKVIDH